MKAWSDGRAAPALDDREAFESFRRSLVPDSRVVLILSAALDGRMAEYTVVIDPATGHSYGEPVGNPYGRLVPLAGETLIDSAPSARAAVDGARATAAAVRSVLLDRHVVRRRRRATRDAVRICRSLERPQAEGLALDAGEAIDGRHPEPAAWRFPDSPLLEVAEVWVDGEWRGARKWRGDPLLLVAATDIASKKLGALADRVAAESRRAARSAVLVSRRVVEGCLAEIWGGGVVES